MIKTPRPSFRDLHGREHAFVIPNPYDAGTARILEKLRFEALATTSAGYAFTLGKRDYQVGRDAMLQHAAELVAATSLPVSADLENGYGDAPEFVAETIRLAAATGLAGCSIEDATQRSDTPIYELGAAVDRIRAAAEAARAQTKDFVLTARCENYLLGRRDIGATIARLQAYQEAGADVLYAPGVVSAADIRAIVDSVDRPVNVLAGMPGMSSDIAALSQLGVKRISVGALLARAAFGAFVRAAKELQSGSTGFAADAVGYAEINGLFS